MTSKTLAAIKDLPAQGTDCWGKGAEECRVAYRPYSHLYPRPTSSESVPRELTQKYTEPNQTLEPQVGLGVSGGIEVGAVGERR